MRVFIEMDLQILPIHRMNLDPDFMQHRWIEKIGCRLACSRQAYRAKKDSGKPNCLAHDARSMTSHLKLNSHTPACARFSPDVRTWKSKKHLDFQPRDR